MQFEVTDGIRSARWSSNLLRDLARHPALLLNLDTWRMLLDILRLKYMSVDLPYNRRMGRGNEVFGVESIPVTTSHVRDTRIPSTRTLCCHCYRLSGVVMQARYWNRYLSRPFFCSLAIHGALCAPQCQLEWRRIDEGAHHLIQVMAESFSFEKVHLRTRVQRLSQGTESQFVLLTHDGQEKHFDHVIFCHPWK